MSQWFQILEQTEESMLAETESSACAIVYAACSVAIYVYDV